MLVVDTVPVISRDGNQVLHLVSVTQVILLIVLRRLTLLIHYICMSYLNKLRKLQVQWRDSDCQ